MRENFEGEEIPREQRLRTGRESEELGYLEPIGEEPGYPGEPIPEEPVYPDEPAPREPLYPQEPVGEEPLYPIEEEPVDPTDPGGPIPREPVYPQEPVDEEPVGPADPIDFFPREPPVLPEPAAPELGLNPRLQSAYAFLQAAGSDGSDLTSRGIHLRWTLLHSLGERHLPKGDGSGPGGKYASTDFFNRAGDYVHVHKAPYDRNHFYVGVSVAKYTSRVETGPTRAWRYEGMQPLPADPSVETTLELRFADVMLYDLARAQVDPADDPYGFLVAYEGRWELEAPGKHLLRACVDFERFEGYPREEPVLYSRMAAAEQDAEPLPLEPDEPGYPIDPVPIDPGPIGPAPTDLGDDVLLPLEPEEPRYPIDPLPKGEPMAWGEAVATRDRRSANDLYVACRGRIWSETGESRLCFICEDTRYVRFRTRGAIPVYLEAQTYEDYTRGVFMNKPLVWRHVGSFALTLDDGDVEWRLHHGPWYDVDKSWPKFNEASSSGEFVVSADNYLDRWHRPDGVREAVERYLDLSRTDPLATEYLSDPSTEPNEAGMEVSYLDTLNVVAQDYHLARMLGLGYIDRDDYTERGAPYVYLMEYVTEAALEPGGAAGLVTHYYLTPPVTMRDYRLPPAPVLRGPRYGLYHRPVENEPPQLLSDEQGYTRYEPSRWINLDREPWEFDGPLPPFWQGDPQACLCTSTLPAFYGVEYRRQGEPGWRRPELLHDPEYTDPAGIPETGAVPESGENPVFTHRETEEGVHEYALYSVNWFSRVSPHGNVVATDDTRFPVLRTLKPPADFAVQLIQPENPLVFTTAAEQARLAAMAGPDRTLVRATFQWDQTHNAAYPFADRVEFFFREKLPESVRGKISVAAGAITVLPGHRVRVRTAMQVVASQTPPEVRQPFLPPSQEPRWIGGAFVVAGKAYVIEDVEFPDPSGNPTFVVAQTRQTSTLETPGGELLTQESWEGPSVTGEPFMAIENLGRPEAWTSRLARAVYLEPFHEAWRVSVSGSAYNDRAYTVRETALAGAQTRITVRESIASSAGPLGSLVYRRRARVVQALPGSAQLRVRGDLVAGPGGLAVGNAVRVFGSAENAGSYTVVSVSAAAGETLVGVSPVPPSAVASGYLDYEKRLPIASADPVAGRFFLAGDRRAELAPPRIEQVAEPDGSVTERVTGGLTGPATITEYPDVDTGGTPIPGSHTGVYQIVFGGLVLGPHVDPGVEWYRGTVRVMEDAALFPPTWDPTYRAPEPKVLVIWEIDTSGPTLRLVAFDPTFDPAFDPASAPLDPSSEYVPIRKGAGVDVNAHPGYRLYLQADTSGGNNFQQSVIFPATGAGSKQTIMAARSVDTSVAATFSPLTPPVALLAQEIREPVPPGVPSGPLFATRPDFYGKATYTFDVEVGSPYALVFYRGSSRSILDALYKPTTVAAILAELAALQSPDADFTTDRWRDLASGVTDSGGRFPQYVPGGWRFPVPDNDRYVLPHENPAVVVRPFASGTALPGTIADAVRTAIEGSFVPLAEQPLIHAYLTAGTVTSGRKPVTRTAGGVALLPGEDGYDPWPMAVRLPGGGVRFTDYTLDGAASDLYFYFGVELSNRMQRSERSPIAGPITLVNSAPPEAPGIREIRVRTANPVLGSPTAVVFTLNDYLPTERVERFRLYRTTDEASARTVRGMEMVKTVQAGEEVADDFAGLDFPLFGEPLFYRVEALRRFTNEEGGEEYAPSWPSEVRQVQVIDDVVPPAPSLSFSYGTPLAGPPAQLPGVTLTWQRTAWNPRYHVFRMNPRGNWVKIHSFATNAETVALDLADTELGSNVLAKQDSGGRTLYHRFKVVTENSSGLLSKVDRPLVI